MLDELASVPALSCGACFPWRLLYTTTIILFGAPQVRMAPDEDRSYIERLFVMCDCPMLALLIHNDNPLTAGEAAAALARLATANEMYKQMVVDAGALPGLVQVRGMIACLPV